MELLLQDMMKVVSLGERFKNLRVSLMHDHSSLSKAFTKSILRIMLNF